MKKWYTVSQWLRSKYNKIADNCTVVFSSSRYFLRDLSCSCVSDLSFDKNLKNISENLVRELVGFYERTLYLDYCIDHCFSHFSIRDEEFDLHIMYELQLEDYYE